MPDIQTPNLTLDNCGGKTVKRNGADCEWFKSLKQCSTLRNIPVKVLHLARTANAPGITVEGRIYWSELQPYLTDNFTRLLAESLPRQNEDNDRDKWELSKLKEEVVKLRNYNRTKSKDYISRKLVLKTVNTLYGNVFAQFQRYLEMEMPGKCDGMSANQLKAYNKDFLVRLFSSLKHQERIWNNADDIKEDVVESVNTGINENV
jgi:hypothetical protein